jgi:hypothetical protein
MRCYLVQSSHMKRYASTNADATATRGMIVEKTGVKKKDVTIEQVDIPVAKSELLGFINSLCAESDVKAEEE